MNKNQNYDVMLVSRVQTAEARYGLGKAIAILGASLETEGLKVLSLCLSDLPPEWGARAEAWTRRINRLATRCFAAYRDFGLIRQICYCVALGHYACEQARRLGIGTIHAHDVGIALGVTSARRRGEALRCGLTQHSFDSTTYAIHQYVQALPSWLRRLGAMLERRVFARVDWAVFLSKASLAATAQQLRREPDARWRVLPHPLPTMRFPDRAVARASFGLQEKEKVLLAVGQLVPMKGFDRLIDACADHARSLRLVFLGEGDSHSLARRAAERGIRCDFVVSDDVTPYFAAADLYVSASLTESYGFANVEAVLAGLPVVATAVGAVPEVLAGSGAILVAPEVDSLKKGIVEALMVDPARQQENRAGWIAAQPTAKTVAAQYRQWYGLS